MELSELLTLTQAQLKKNKKADLQNYCKQFELSEDGNKAELTDRLWEYLESQREDNTMEETEQNEEEFVEETEAAEEPAVEEAAEEAGDDVVEEENMDEEPATEPAKLIEM